MKLATKLLAAPLLTAVVVLAAGQINTFLLNRQAEAGLSSSRSSLQDFKTMAEANQQMAEVHASVYRTVAVIASLDEAKIKSLREDFAKQLDGVKRVVRTLSEQSGTDASKTQALETFIVTYAKQADSAINFASMDPNTGIAAMQRADLTFKELLKASSTTTSDIEAASDASIAASQSKGQTISITLAVAAFGMGGIAVWLSWLMQVRIVVELARAAKIASEVARGNLTVNAQSERNDEVGDVMRALGAMTVQLNQSLRTVRDSSESIRISSSEIATGNQDLSVRTEQTASNLQRASASTAQLTGTVAQSAEAAHQASQLASSAAEVAARGGRSGRASGGHHGRHQHQRSKNLRHHQCY